MRCLTPYVRSRANRTVGRRGHNPLCHAISSGPRTRWTVARSPVTCGDIR
jgi:hypothetical protein